MRWIQCALWLFGWLCQPLPVQGETLERAWSVEQLATAPGSTVALALGNGGALKRVSTSAIRRLYAVYSALEAAAETPATFVLVNGVRPNAFAGTDGGRLLVGINFAMFDLLDDDLHMAAAVLGHELAHLKLAHGEKSARRAATGNVLGALGEIVLGGLGVPGGGMLSHLTVNAVDSAYSRDQEREADYLGTIWAVETGFDPDGAARLHARLLKLSGGSSFLSSHPSGPERVATLKALATRLRR